MGSNLTPFSIAIGWKKIYFLTPKFQIVRKEGTQYDDDVEFLTIVCQILRYTRLKKYNYLKFIQFTIRTDFISNKMN